MKQSKSNKNGISSKKPDSPEFNSDKIDVDFVTWPKNLYLVAGKDILIKNQTELREHLKKDRRVKVIRYVPKEFWIAKLSQTGTVTLDDNQDLNYD